MVLSGCRGDFLKRKVGEHRIRFCMFNCHADKVPFLIDINVYAFTNFLCLLHLTIGELNMSCIGI